MRSAQKKPNLFTCFKIIKLYVDFITKLSKISFDIDHFITYTYFIAKLVYNLISRLT